VVHFGINPSSLLFVWPPTATSFLTYHTGEYRIALTHSEGQCAASRNQSMTRVSGHDMIGTRK